MKKVLNQLFEYKTLSRKEAEEVLTNIASGTYSEPEIAAFITVYLMRSISVAELSGFRDALMNLCIQIDLSDFDIVDVCGTGGDGKNSFNISTLVAFVLAGAGLKVAKHGNFAVTSACGSSNIMEYLGYKFSTRCDKLRCEIDRTGICFLHAPLFNPAMKNIAPVRKALKIKTFFNMLGPLVNPASPGKQLTGVYSLELARLYNYLFQESGKQYAIVHNLDGYDEISLTSDFKVIMNGIEQIFNPELLNYERTSPAALHGGATVGLAADIFTGILQGKGSEAQNSVVVVNAQMALKCCLPSKSHDECRAIAEESLFSGKALGSLKKLIEMQ
ncbi:MAG: anthranilate phosphoribosyltransferase [Bacteroidales bacterium]|nr:anthranilate phosphoribosyltransferase [Bacteroidales bacterium]